MPSLCWCLLSRVSLTRNVFAGKRLCKAIIGDFYRAAVTHFEAL